MLSKEKNKNFDNKNIKLILKKENYLYYYLFIYFIFFVDFFEYFFFVIFFFCFNFLKNKIIFS